VLRYNGFPGNVVIENYQSGLKSQELDKDATSYQIFNNDFGSNGEEGTRECELLSMEEPSTIYDFLTISICSSIWSQHLQEITYEVNASIVTVRTSHKWTENKDHEHIKILFGSSTLAQIEDFLPRK